MKYAIALALVLASCTDDATYTPEPEPAPTAMMWRCYTHATCGVQVDDSYTECMPAEAGDVTTGEHAAYESARQWIASCRVFEGVTTPLELAEGERFPGQSCPDRYTWGCAAECVPMHTRCAP